MTRFARAKGSKASNERVPDDSTPWEVMKDQLLKSKKENEEAKKREEAEKQRIENYENFLREQKVQKRKATWCDFPETVNNSNNKTQQELPKKKKKKNKQNPEGIKDEDISELSTKENGSHNRNNDNIQNDNKDKIKNQKKKNKHNKVKNYTNEDQAKQNEINESNSVHDSENVYTPMKNKYRPNKFKVPSNADQIISAEMNIGNNSKEESTEINKQNKQIKPDKQKNREKKLKNKKAKKFENSEPVRRKPLNDRTFQLIINGKEVELVRYDGFPIMKKDAERLDDLKKSMVKKGIPKSEVQRTIKLERRRAEKALARLKRDVCYNCRKGGHNLSDCPDLKSKIPGVDGAEGICFKCGSTEHRQFECKVQKDKEFRFATCFICKEAGHIARQCPDNPKGLYPNGGCCKLCGDVTHLRKDCPTIKDKREETSIKLQTLDSTEDIEGVGQSFKASGSEEKVKKPKKIKF